MIELIVVIGIIGLLIGITMPSLGKARVQAKRTKCMANLKAIGQGIQAYLNVNGDRYFYAAEFPSAEEEVAEAEDREPYPSIREALSIELGRERSGEPTRGVAIGARREQPHNKALNGDVE